MSAQLAKLLQTVFPSRAAGTNFSPVDWSVNSPGRNPALYQLSLCRLPALYAVAVDVINVANGHAIASACPTIWVTFVSRSAVTRCCTRVGAATVPGRRSGSG